MNKNTIYTDNLAKTRLEIILHLLDGQKTPQKDLPDAIGKAKSTVSLAIKALEKQNIITRTVQPGNSYRQLDARLAYDHDHGREILDFLAKYLDKNDLTRGEEYNLISRLRGSEKILDAIAHKHYWLVVMNGWRLKRVHDFCAQEDDLAAEKIREKCDESFNERIELFKKYLSISDSFFKMCLRLNSTEIMKLYTDIYPLTKLAPQLIKLRQELEELTKLPPEFRDQPWEEKYLETINYNDFKPISDIDPMFPWPVPILLFEVLFEFVGQADLANQMIRGGVDKEFRDLYEELRRLRSNYTETIDIIFGEVITQLKELKENNS